MFDNREYGRLLTLWDTKNFSIKIFFRNHEEKSKSLLQQHKISLHYTLLVELRSRQGVQINQSYVPIAAKIGNWTTVDHTNGQNIYRKLCMIIACLS